MVGPGHLVRVWVRVKVGAMVMVRVTATIRRRDLGFGNAHGRL